MSEMRYGKIPNVDKKVSRIFFGTASEPFLKGEDENCLLDAVYDQGVNTFDTARVYGLSERSLGSWMAERGIRNQVVILSKCAHPDVPSWRKRINEKEIREDLEESLRLLRTDYIDIYLLHRDDPEIEAGVIVEIMNDLHKEGKIGAFGGSNWTHQRITEANEYARQHQLVPFTVSSPNFGLAEQGDDLWGGGCVTISGPQNEEARAWYRQTQMPVVAYSSLARGFFSGRVKGDEPEKASLYMDEISMKGYASPDNFERLRRCEKLAAEKHCSVSQIALAWIFRQDLNTFAVVSTSRPARMQENIDALSIPLTEEEERYLDLKGQLT